MARLSLSRTAPTQWIYHPYGHLYTRRLHLRSSDGKITTLSSFHGKPVFVEFWSTLCAPCVDLIPELSKLYAETEGKGLVWVSIDSDEDPDGARKFILHRHISWPNYHDEDGSLGKTFQREAIPLGVSSMRMAK